MGTGKSSTEGMGDAATAESFLDRVRRSGIRIDRQGAFWHEGEVVEHEGLRQALFRWLDREPDGRHVLRLDAQRFAYIDVDDTPLVCESLRLDADQALMTLSDGSEERLSPDGLTVDAEGVMRAVVRGGRLEARLGTAAASTLADRVVESPEGPRLRLGPTASVIRPR